MRNDGLIANSPGPVPSERPMAIASMCRRSQKADLADRRCACAIYVGVHALQGGSSPPPDESRPCRCVTCRWPERREVTGPGCRGCGLAARRRAACRARGAVTPPATMTCRQMTGGTGFRSSADPCGRQALTYVRKARPGHAPWSYGRKPKGDRGELACHHQRASLRQRDRRAAGWSGHDR